MGGIGMGLAVAGSGTLLLASRSAGAEDFPVVGWGDSLTAGIGATEGHDYLSQAAAAFDPHRSIVNRGRGGQDARQIAARQGGVPLLVSVAGDEIPPLQTERLSWDFDDGTLQGAGFIRNPASSPAGSALVADGKAVVTAPSYQQGLWFALPAPRTTRGEVLEVTIDIEMPEGMKVRVSGLPGPNSWVWAMRGPEGADGYDVTGSGRHRFGLIVGNTADTRNTVAGLCVVTDASPSGEAVFRIDAITIALPPPPHAVAVTDKSVNILFNSGTFAGSAKGVLAGVHGTMSTDEAGNWTFTRDTEGPALACPPDTRFIPDEATAYRNHTNWIWAGNNGVVASGEGAGAADSVAGMVAFLPHDRYLVLSALPRPDRVAAVAELNGLLLAAHGDRFVDVLSALAAGHDDSPGDLEDVAQGLVPRSLRADVIHLNDAGYRIVAEEVHRAAARKGW